MTRQHFPDFARHFSILKRQKMVCHAGTARLPRRHGTSATPAWYVCRAGVAKYQNAYRHGSVLAGNGYMAYNHDFTLRCVLSIIFTLHYAHRLSLCRRCFIVRGFAFYPIKQTQTDGKAVCFRLAVCEMLCWACSSGGHD